MRINHNIASLNTHAQMVNNSNAQAKSLEKLSSGLRINRAGDDAAGLAISEKMRGQVRGLDQAQRNSQDAISLIQTAEGALNETQNILQRMRELAVQAGNDTNTTVDRKEIQKEVNQLTSEINRISNTTEFNTQKLLEGNASGGLTMQIGANKAGATFYEGIARIMKAHNFAMLVDIYGNVPYSEALKGSQVTTPKYDNGADIYKDLLRQLDKAIDLIKNADESTTGPNGNILTDDVMFETVPLSDPTMLLKASPKPNDSKNLFLPFNDANKAAKPWLTRPAAMSCKCVKPCCNKSLNASAISPFV